MADDFRIFASRATEPFFYRAPAPDKVIDIVREYQHAGVEYHLARTNALFGDAPGLGKTAECILLGNAIRARRTLVVCPASLRLKWEREVWTWSTTPNVLTYPVTKSSDGVNLGADYVIISYALLLNPAIRDALMSVTWDHLVLDEAHALKDPKGNQRVKTICGGSTKGVYREGLASVSGRVTMATGTILPNQPIECYNAVRLLNWDAIDRASLADFRDYYYEYGEGFVFKRVFNGFQGVWTRKSQWSNKVRNVPRNLGDLQHRLRKHVMVRRLKEQVLHELPRKQWSLFPLELTADVKRALRHEGWERVERLYELDPDDFHAAAPIDGEVSTARRLLGEAKAPQVADYARELLAGGVEKLVVGAWHLSVLAYLREQLEGHGLAYMDGSVSQVGKQVAVDSFRADPGVRVILGQMMPLGEGWDLELAQDVLFAEPDWVPGKNDQLLDRVHRLGQRGSYVLGHLPVVPGTLDERMVAAAVRKSRAIHEALDRDWGR